MDDILIAEKTVYDESTDTKYYEFIAGVKTDEEEVEPGVHVLWEYDNGRTNNIAAIEFENFAEKYGEKVFTIIHADRAYLLSLR